MFSGVNLLSCVSLVLVKWIVLWSYFSQVQTLSVIDRLLKIIRVKMLLNLRHLSITFLVRNLKRISLIVIHLRRLQFLFFIWYSLLASSSWNRKHRSLRYLGRRRKKLRIYLFFINCFFWTLLRRIFFILHYISKKNF